MSDEKAPLPVIIDDGSINDEQSIVIGQGPTIQQYGQSQRQGFNNYNQGYLPNN